MARVDPRWFRYLGWNSQGDLGPLTMYTDKRRQLIWFPKMPPLNPPSIRQTQQRDRFRAIGLAWWELTTPEREAWENASKLARLRITGYNLFSYWFITQDSATIRTIESQTGLDLIQA